MKILVTTDKAPFKGVIVSNEYKFMPEVAEYILGTQHNIYAAKHSDGDVNRAAYAGKGGIVNRYGWLLTDDTLFSDDESSIVFKDGWFKKQNINCINDIDIILAKEV